MKTTKMSSKLFPLLLVFLLAGCATQPKPAPPEWLNNWYDIQQHVDKGPEGAEELIFWANEGSYDGDLEQFVAFVLLNVKYDVYPILMPLFSDKNPKVRGFVVRVAGYLGDKRYLHLIEKLKDDKSKLPGYFDRTVSFRAESGKRILLEGGFTVGQKKMFQEYFLSEKKLKESTQGKK